MRDAREQLRRLSTQVAHKIWDCRGYVTAAEATELERLQRLVGQRWNAALEEWCDLEEGEELSS